MGKESVGGEASMADGGAARQLDFGWNSGSPPSVSTPGTACTGPPTPAGPSTSPSSRATLPVPTPPSSAASLRIRVAVEGPFCSLLEGKHSDGKCNGQQAARRTCPYGLVDVDLDVDSDLDVLVLHFDSICP